MAIIAITTSNPGVDLDEDVLVAVVVVDAGVGVVVVVTPALPPLPSAYLMGVTVLLSI